MLDDLINEIENMPLNKLTDLLKSNGVKFQSDIISEGKWYFDGREWSNECNKCCYDCLELCDEYCEKVFISECMCAGCKHDI